MAMKNSINLITSRSNIFPKRWFSTVTVTDTALTKGTKDGVSKTLDEDSLYRRLSALGGTKEDVSKTLDEWIKEGKTVKKFALVSIIHELRKFNKYQHALQVYEWMEKGNSKLNNADRAKFIDLLTQTKGIASAESYFNTLQRSAKTQKTYGAILYCYCKSNMLDKATEIFETMKELKLITVALTYNNMMFLYNKVGQPEKVPLLAQEMEEKNVAADSYTYNHLMNSLAALGDFESFEKLSEKMERDGVNKDWFTHGNMATLYINAGLVEKANDALQKLEKIENLHDREAFHTLITLYARISNLSGVNRSWESLKLARPKIYNNSYLVMLLALSKLGDVKGLEEYFKEWESVCAIYDVRVSNVMLESYLERDMFEEANSLSENMEKRVGELNMRTLDLFMNYFLKKGNMDLAMQYLEKGVSRTSENGNNWFPSEKSVTKFLHYFEEETNIDVDKFCDMMKKNRRLEEIISNSTMKGAGKILEEMRKKMEGNGVEITPDFEISPQKVCSP